MKTKAKSFILNFIKSSWRPLVVVRHEPFKGSKSAWLTLSRYERSLYSFVTLASANREVSGVVGRVKVPRICVMRPREKEASNSKERPFLSYPNFMT